MNGKKGAYQRREITLFLTAEISRAAFGMTPSEYKDHKGIDFKMKKVIDER